jgi:hypothetical protein
MTVSQTVDSSQNALNLFLVLVTIFTSLQATNLGVEQLRKGGPSRSRVVQIGVIAFALAVCDFVVIWSLESVVHLVLISHGTSAWSPTFPVFLLSYLLVTALVIWQVVLTFRAGRLVNSAH